MLSQGAIIEVARTTDSSNWFRIAKPTEIPLPTPNVDEHEIMNLDSEDKEFEAGLADNGEIAIPFFVTAEGEGVDEYCEEWAEDRDTRHVRVTGPSGRTRTFLAFCKGYSGSYQTNTPLQRTITLRVTGRPERGWVNS